MPTQLGLSQSDVQERIRQGKVNRTNRQTSRSVADIIKTNLLSIANIILLTIVFILILVGKPGDAFATGGVVVINVFVGTFQEFRAKRKLDQIALLTRPRVSVLREGQEVEIDQAEVVVDDVIVLHAGDQAVVDGKIIEDPRENQSTPSVDMDESLLTGESDLIRKFPGDEILSGSFCVVGSSLYVAEKVGDDSFAQKLTSGARQYTQVVTPLQREISIIVRVLVVLAITLSVLLGLAYAYQEKSFADGIEDAAVVISLVPQGLLLMITVAYALGAVRIAAKGALVQQSNAVESISHVDVLCLDKTGTLTTNRILFNAVHPLNNQTEEYGRTSLANYIASTGAANRTAEAVAEALPGQQRTAHSQIPFSSARKWAAASFKEGDAPGTFVFGAPEMMQKALPAEIKFDDTLNELAEQGLRVLLLAHSTQIIEPDSIPEDREADLPDGLNPVCLVSFSDELRPDVNEVLNNFRKAGIHLRLISGDNPVTVAALARKAGFTEKDLSISGTELAKMTPSEFTDAVRTHSIFGRITPEQKRAIVDVLQGDDHYVAMMGDGVNDVLSLKRAEVGIAMEDGSQATRSVADIVLLGNKFSALPEAFLEGQRILNGMHDTTRLFLTRTLYTALLIIIAGFVGTDFPLTPRHNFLLTTLPVGIPAFFLAAWAKTGNPKESLITSVTRFVFPVGFSLTVLSTFIWILYLTYGVATIETGRTVLSTAALIGGLWVIILAEHEREDWYETHVIRTTDRRRFVLAGAMLLLFAIVMVLPDVRESFELTTMSWADLGTIAASMSVWASAIYLMLRYDILERIMIPGYKRSVDVDVED